MTRAVVKNGVIIPVDPLPPEWTDGKEVVVRQVEELDETAEAIDRRWRELEALCADSDPEDEEIIQKAIEEQRKESKAYMRRKAGLPE